MGLVVHFVKAVHKKSEKSELRTTCRHYRFGLIAITEKIELKIILTLIVSLLFFDVNPKLLHSIYLSPAISFRSVFMIRP